MRPRSGPRWFRPPVGWGQPSASHEAMRVPTPGPAQNPGFAAGIAAGALGAAAIGGGAALVMKSREDNIREACKVGWWSSSDGSAAIGTRMGEIVSTGAPPPGGWNLENLVGAAMESLAPGCLAAETPPLTGDDWLTLARNAEAILAGGTVVGPPDGHTQTGDAPVPMTPQFDPIPGQTAEFDPLPDSIPAEPYPNPGRPNGGPADALYTLHHQSTALASGSVGPGSQVPEWAADKLNQARYKLDQVKHAVEHGVVAPRPTTGYDAHTNAKLAAEYSAWLHEALQGDKQIVDWMAGYIRDAYHDVQSVFERTPSSPRSANPAPGTVTTPRRRLQARRSGTS